MIILPEFNSIFPSLSVTDSIIIPLSVVNSLKLSAFNIPFKLSPVCAVSALCICTAIPAAFCSKYAQLPPSLMIYIDLPILLGLSFLMRSKAELPLVCSVLVDIVNAPA